MAFGEQEKLREKSGFYRRLAKGNLRSGCEKVPRARFYCPGGKILTTSAKHAGFLFVLSTFFDCTCWEDSVPWENAFSWASPTREGKPGILNHRIQPPDFILEEDMGNGFAREYHKLFPMIYSLACAARWARGEVSDDDAKSLVELAPKEFLSESIKNTDNLRVMLEHLARFTEKQRIVATAILILRRRASISGKDPRKGDILREMENQWGVKMSPSALAYHFKKAPLLRFLLQPDGARISRPHAPRKCKASPEQLAKQAIWGARRKNSEVPRLTPQGRSGGVRGVV